MAIINQPTPGLESHQVFHQAATGFVSIQSIRETAEMRIDKFCGDAGKSVRVLTERTSKQPHVAGNFPRIEIVFECVNVETPAHSSSKYDDLAKLKGLLDSGAVTLAEHESEKGKLLQSDQNVSILPSTSARNGYNARFLKSKGRPPVY